jgi:hypothetical protein
MACSGSDNIARKGTIAPKLIISTIAATNINANNISSCVCRRGGKLETNINRLFIKDGYFKSSIDFFIIPI